MDPQEFRRKCALWCTGVSIVTTTDTKGKHCGLTLNSVASLSIDPPLMLICVDNNSETLDALLEKGFFCINVLSQDQEELAKRFCAQGDRFSGVALSTGLQGIPLIDGAIVSFECEVEDVHPGGDHKIVVGRLKNIVDGDTSREPLIFINGSYC